MIGVVCMPLSSKFITESTVRKKNVKIGQYLAKIWEQSTTAYFFGPACIVNFIYSRQILLSNTGCLLCIVKSRIWFRTV